MVRRRLLGLGFVVLLLAALSLSVLQYRKVFTRSETNVIARWIGTYASADRLMFVDTPAPDVRLVMITGGNGASTSFAIAEEVIADLFGARLEDIRRSA